VVGALILLSVGRVISTYRVFSQLWDEPYHIATGLEWWQNGVYHLAAEQPPLSHIFVSALLYFRGVRLSRFEDPWPDGNTALTASGRYAENLTCARLGTLPFWIVSCLLVFVIGRRLYGGATALLALLLCSTLPPLLGFAGFAYTDMALVAGMLFFAWRWAAFTNGPGIRSGFWLGVSVSFALLSKYSAIPYMGVAAALTAAVAIRGRRIPPPRAATVIRLGAIALCIGLTVFLFTWACFRFSVEPIFLDAGRAHTEVDRRVGPSGLLHRVAYLAVETPLPLAEVFRGVGIVYAHAKRGHWTYNFGKVRRTGSLYYFPVLLVLTIPAGLILLSILGGLSLRHAKDGRRVLMHQALFTVPVAVLLVNAFSSIDIGDRHNLAVYPFVCLVGGIGCVDQWRRRRFRLGWRLLVAALVGQHLISSALAHPDYASYFNFLAGRAPEEIDTNTRCIGGDEWRLASRLRQLGAQHVCLALEPPLLPLGALGLPPYTLVERNVPCEGWVAVAITRSQLDWQHASDPSDTGLGWLASYQPVERIGRSILLYRIPAPPWGRGQGQAIWLLWSGRSRAEASGGQALDNAVIRHTAPWFPPPGSRPGSRSANLRKTTR
jgi:4-amino-4-deoxy-L-arabinose transferase-like glycosyltransferase